MMSNNCVSVNSVNKSEILDMLMQVGEVGNRLIYIYMDSMIYTICLLTQGLQTTCCEGISDIIGDAGASWAVAPHLALSIDAASARAWVDTLVPLACFVGWAIRVDHTLWSARHVWISKIFRNALTRASIPLPVANCVGSARRRIAWINWLHPWWHWNNEIK